MAAADWPRHLGKLFAKEGADTLKASKAIKKAVKAAAKRGGQPADSLKAELQAFLHGGGGGYRLEGKRIVRAAASKQGEQEGRPPRVLATAEEAPPRKKRKKDRAEGRKDADAPAPAAEVHAEGDQQGKESGEKRRAGEAADASAAVEPAAKKKKKKRAAPAAADAPAAGEEAAGGGGEGSEEAGPGGGSGDDDQDVADMRWKDSNSRVRVKSGPFSKAEKETLRKAVEAYAAANGLSMDDLTWLYTSSKRGETKGAWGKIAASLPHRTVKSVWSAGTRMFHEGNYQGRWTPEEDAQLLQLVSEKGRRWTEIGGVLGRYPLSCRDRWLMVRLGDEKRQGKWEDDEVERLRQAVGDYLAARNTAEAAGEGEDELTLTLEDIEGATEAPAVDEDGAAAFTVSRRVVLDDIDWSVVSQAVGTRTNIQCLEKWYTQLSPSMVARGEWGSGDDRRLLRALYLSGAAQDFDVDWSQLVRGRTAAQARRRWRLMVKVVPDHRDMEFPELVEHLVDRYLPQLKERAAAAAPAAPAAEQDPDAAAAADGGADA